MQRTPVVIASLLAATPFLFCSAEETVGSTEAETAGPYPLEYFARRPVIGNVRLSPDGKYLALMKIPSKGGNPVVEVYLAADFTKDPFRMNADPMEITGLTWVSDTDMVFGARQQVRRRIEGFNRGTWESKLGLVNVETRKLKAFDDLGISIEHRLPRQPNKIIVSMLEGGTEGRVGRTFRPRSYHELDLGRGSKKLLIRGKLSLGNISFDGAGNPWLARGFDPGKRELIWYWRPPSGSGWEEFRREHVDEFAFQPFFVGSLDPEKPNHALVFARNGHDTVGLWSYDLENKEFREAIYRRSDVDLYDVVFHSNPWSNPGTVVGLSYITDKTHIEYFDEEEGAVHRQLADIVPYAHDVDIISRSRDGASMVVHNSGPRGPRDVLPPHEQRADGGRQPTADARQRTAGGGRVHELRGPGRNPHPGLHHYSQR